MIEKSARPFGARLTGLTVAIAAAAVALTLAGAVFFSDRLRDAAPGSAVGMLLLICLPPLFLSFFLARRVSRRLQGPFLGRKLESVALQLRQQQEILDAIEEGVVAIDKTGAVIFFNRAAAGLFSWSPEALGKPLSSLCPSSLGQVLQTRQPQYNLPLSFLPTARVLADHIPLYDGGQLVGALSICRNRTEVERLTENLSDVRHMVDAMRAYTHEFMNKLHVILGLLEIGETETARQYILDTARLQQEAVSRILRQIQEPSVAALLIGKTSRANELGIRLILDRDSALSRGGDWLSPEAYVTLLGNLLENAIECLNKSPCQTKEVTVSIRETEQTLFLCVEDTGPGIPAALRQTLFLPGVSTKGAGRGTGLTLVQDVVDLYHGQIRVESESGVGTSFFVRFQKDALSPS